MDLVSVPVPTKEEIRKFLEIIETLNQFEVDHRLRCGWSVWTEDVLPFPEAVKVTAWLRQISSGDSHGQI